MTSMNDNSGYEYLLITKNILLQVAERLFYFNGAFSAMTLSTYLKTAI